MKLKLQRIYQGETYTIGQLYIDGSYFCDTLEDKVRDINENGTFDGDEKKVYAHTAIPFGTYPVQLNMSPRFKRHMPILLNVPHFSGIRIHAGNDDGDTEGCILVGENTVKGKVLNSRHWENKLVALMQERDEEMEIEVC